MQIAINFQNETIAQKVLWLLERFKNDGVEIIKLDSSLSEKSVIEKSLDAELEKRLEAYEEGRMKFSPIENLSRLRTKYEAMNEN